MSRVVFLDAGPLGLLVNSLARARAERCWRWVRTLASAGTFVYIPEIADYEVRRELLRLRRDDGISRVDVVRKVFYFAPINSHVMLRAARLWADARRTGKPTAHPEALDADVILAAQALSAVGRGDTVTVATVNVRHLSRFVDAVPCEQISV